MTIGRQLHFLFHSALLSHFLFHSALLSACLYSPKQENVMIRNLVPSYSYMVLYYDLRLGWSFPRFDLICSVLLWMKIANNKQDEHGKKEHFTLWSINSGSKRIFKRSNKSILHLWTWQKIHLTPSIQNQVFNEFNPPKLIKSDQFTP